MGRCGGSGGRRHLQATRAAIEVPRWPIAECSAGLGASGGHFENTKKECHFDSLDEGDEAAEGGALIENDQLHDEDVKLKKSHRHLDKIKAKYRSAVTAVNGAAQGASDRTKWALYKRKHLTELVEKVGKLIDRLEKLFPELLQVEKTFAKEEAEGAEREVLQVLPALADIVDPLMAGAFKAQGQLLGMIFEDVEAGEYSRTHLGNKYAAGEKSTGHDDHQFKKLKLGGNSVFHGGNYYGAKQEAAVGGAEDEGRARAPQK